MKKLKVYMIAGLLSAISLLAGPAFAQSATGTYKPFMSDGGKQIVQQYMTKRNADIAPLLRKKSELQARMSALLTPQTYNDAKLAQVMAEMGAVEAQLFSIMSSSMLAILKVLPDYDREAFMQSISKTPPSGSARPGQ
jgi:hypothetical protein